MRVLRTPPRPFKPVPEHVVPVHGDYITLGQLLKVAGIIDNGGAAKFYLAETVVQVNGESEQRRGRKLYPGDRIVAPGGRPIRLTGERPDTAADSTTSADSTAPTPTEESLDLQ